MILEENLKDAIIGKNNTKRKYELFAEKAKAEGYNTISFLFNAIARAESIHVKNHLKALSVLKRKDFNASAFVTIDEQKLKERVKDTRSNLVDAMEL
ncbi:MAG: ferritin family protein [Promethearchaeota archaeon]